MRSNDTETYNAFLTFSNADLHHDELHRLLPGHEEYIDKTVSMPFKVLKVNRFLYITFFFFH